MLFVLSKVFIFFAAPGHFFVLLLLAGGAFALWSRRAVVAKVLIGTGLAGLLVFGFSPASSFMMFALEERFPPAGDVARGRYAGIIVLGGFEDNRIISSRGQLALISAAERMTETVRLARRLPETKVIITGGSAANMRRIDAGAGEVARYFREVGIAPSRIVVESQSRNTWENATLTRALIAPAPTDRFLLVTSAWHMPRAMGVFRQAGFNVSAWPVDYRTAGGSDLAMPYRELTEGLVNTNVATKEYIGLVAYWLAGRTSALFPAPDRPSVGNAASSPIAPKTARAPLP